MLLLFFKDLDAIESSELEQLNPTIGTWSVDAKPAVIIPMKDDLSKQNILGFDLWVFLSNTLWCMPRDALANTWATYVS